MGLIVRNRQSGVTTLTTVLALLIAPDHTLLVNVRALPKDLANYPYLQSLKARPIIKLPPNLFATSGAYGLPTLRTPSERI